MVVDEDVASSLNNRALECCRCNEAIEGSGARVRNLIALNDIAGTDGKV